MTIGELVQWVTHICWDQAFNSCTSHPLLWSQAEPSNHHHSADKVPSCPSYGFSSSHVWIWELDHKEVWVSKKWFFPAVVLEKTLDIPLDKLDQTRQSWRKSTLNIHWKDWCWIWSFNTLATWCEEPSHLERHWCWEGLKAGGEGNDRGWDGWMAPPTPWTWVWASSGHSEGQGGLACCSLWGHKESDTTAWLNNNNTLTSLASGEQQLLELTHTLDHYRVQLLTGNC